MAKEREKLKPSMVAKISEQVFSMPVTKVTAPGGKSRESLRVHFQNRTIVATQREYEGRMKMEVAVLKGLTEQGAPVPKFLGGNDQIFFQEDVGARRLSGELAAAAGEAKVLDVAARAFESLVELREAGEKAGLADKVPALGVDAKWIGGFMGTSVRTSSKLKFAPPDVDFQTLLDRLAVPATTFVKWDARPGNASIGNNGKVYWFDWEHCGKRQGIEDFAWLAGDEFWPLGADQVIPILKDVLPKDRAGTDLEYLNLFITFHIVQRLTIIHRRFVKAGWVDADKAMRYDKIGVDPDLARRLCNHGKSWAVRDPLTRPMQKWFDDCAAALAG